MITPSILSGCLLGWALGGNDSANCFATAVSTKVVKYSRAIIIIAIFTVLGAVLEGEKGVYKLSDFAYTSGVTSSVIAFLVMLGAALTVIVMTLLKFPVSTSQAVIGAILGVGLLTDKADFKYAFTFFSAWVFTPLGGMLIGYILYKFTEEFIEKKFSTIYLFDVFIRIGYIVAGAFSAYSLGANNVANVTSIYSGKLNLITPNEAVWIGGISIALGSLTFSKQVMMTVGNKLTILSPTAGFIAIISSAIVVYIYAQIGIPVSSSQAIVGSIIGIGLVKGARYVNFKMLKNILLAWIATPTVAALITFVAVSILK